MSSSPLEVLDIALLCSCQTLSLQLKTQHSSQTMLLQLSNYRVHSASRQRRSNRLRRHSSEPPASSSLRFKFDCPWSLKARAVVAGLDSSSLCYSLLVPVLYCMSSSFLHLRRCCRSSMMQCFHNRDSTSAVCYDITGHSAQSPHAFTRLLS
jgi:hypothetical protein